MTSVKELPIMLTIDDYLDLMYVVNMDVLMFKSTN